jgi:hypothetical protein
MRGSCLDHQRVPGARGCPPRPRLEPSGRPRTFHGHVQDNKQKFLLSTSLTVNQRQGNQLMKTIGVDVGGTFTDLVYCDMASGELAVHKVATTPDDPSLGVYRGHIAPLRQCRRCRRLDRFRVSRNHDRDQRSARTQGRPLRHDHQRGLPRHPSYRPPSGLSVRSSSCEAFARL